MPELRHLRREVVGLELWVAGQELVHLFLVLARGDRAGGVDKRPARTDVPGRGLDQPLLYAAELLHLVRLLSPAGVRSRLKRAEVRAGWVEQHAVVTVLVFADELRSVLTAHVHPVGTHAAAIGLQRVAAPGVALHRHEATAAAHQRGDVRALR